MSVFHFPRWSNIFRPILGITSIAAPVYLTGLFAFGASPENLNVGYKPVQPVPFSHALHAGELGMDCRYCHNTVQEANHAAIPPTATCMNCHTQLHKESDALALVRESAATGKPIQWVRVHDLPDYVRFDHSAHLHAGISCVSCHGRVDQMEVVEQVEPLSMGWCLDCHRNPEPNIRPKSEVFNLAWQADEAPHILGAKLRKEYGVNPQEDCSTCHR
ncbi:MAG: cytochrome c3 family protein [Planctomycetes bacterium]|jgi:hypothetical protein|nr:cytochrome c3 family protein [Planctomycetota bacterium]MBT4029815.1 cytochrome c3 family protein [Planctomycetota bacterium]MBT4559909.1 cytochrome c3 family protein [Planctomycetota bacterium]MBT5100873.1 cytochrome c3 family protein [Planctomycetota bacterium]MBT7012267.1 cytochrome c3 family protein [Planctomycetota bacterium]